MMRLYKVFVVPLLCASLVHSAPIANNRFSDDGAHSSDDSGLHKSRAYLVNRLTGEDYPGVVYYGQQPQPVFYAAQQRNPLFRDVTYVAVPVSPQRGVLDTIQQFVTSAASTITSGFNNVIPDSIRPPYTINVPNVVNGLVNRVNTGINYAQSAWQNRPAFLIPTSNRRPAIEPEAEIVPSDELVQAANAQPIVIFSPEAPIASRL